MTRVTKRARRGRVGEGDTGVELEEDGEGGAGRGGSAVEFRQLAGFKTAAEFPSRSRE